ncbi:MAG: tetraacyldisaccharide 4'-kinase [Alphaproteobacteria bacterium]|nr:tetraacyldisaccharide 4'-kinase [Alphaproteobacteria bacterium]
MHTPEFWREKNAVSTALLPASYVYALGFFLRRACARPEKLPVPVICIGNLVAGGAGKTPLAFEVGEMVKAMGRRAFFLSRGYGGSLQGPVRVSPQHSAAAVGDEPLLLARLLPTIVAKNRVAGAKAAIAEGAEVIIMDDGFQNPTLAKDFSLLAVDGAYRFGNGHLLPAGPLRQSVADGLKRADAVVTLYAALALPGDVPVFQGRLIAPAGWEGMRVFGFAGIAHPEKFKLTLKAMGCTLAGFTPFPDHHPYAETELEGLWKEAKASGARLVTTEKDAVRLPPSWRERVLTVPVRLEIEGKEALRAMLRKAMGDAER